MQKKLKVAHGSWLSAVARMQHQQKLQRHFNSMYLVSRVKLQLFELLVIILMLVIQLLGHWAQHNVIWNK